MIHHSIPGDDTRQGVACTAECQQQRCLSGEDIRWAGRVPFGQAQVSGGLFQQRIFLHGFRPHQDLPDSIPRAGGQDHSHRQGVFRVAGLGAGVLPGHILPGNLDPNRPAPKSLGPQRIRDPW